MDGNLFIRLHVSTRSYVWSQDDIYNSGDYCPSWTAVFHHFFLFSSFQFDWLTASLLFIPRDRNLARGTCCRHLYCWNHSDQTWDKYDVFFFLLFFWFEGNLFCLRRLPSMTFLHSCTVRLRENAYYDSLFIWTRGLCLCSAALMSLAFFGFSVLHRDGCGQFQLVRKSGMAAPKERTIFPLRL